jgi:hypothetical protein
VSAADLEKAQVTITQQPSRSRNGEFKWEIEPPILPGGRLTPSMTDWGTDMNHRRTAIVESIRTMYGDLNSNLRHNLEGHWTEN